MNVPTHERPNTLDRWQAALIRAWREGVDLRQLVGSGAWIATSASDGTAAFMVTEHTCECFAAEFSDPVCKHRALLRHRLGHLPTPERLSRPLPRRRKQAAPDVNQEELLLAAA
ncbi:MAG TPA: hypothetical protein VGR08_10060 [Thermomicrobiales bacterium]|nr:hypothetical protein [Thermomicrobiales bacterium]